MEQINWNNKGLPPVGAVCEFMSTQAEGPHEFEEVEVMYLSGVTVVVRRCVPVGHYVEEFICHPISARFRPIRTPEQVAADERNQAKSEIQAVIVEGFDIDKITASGIAGYIADAGFRRATAQ